MLRDAVLDLAGRRDRGLAAWIAAEAAFPETMVDRITPVTRPADIAALRDRHYIADRWPVFAEPFRQWVIEDRFVQGRPAWEEVGAQFVADVGPYEIMKLRLLNASHLAVAGLGRLAGCTYIDETMADPLLRAYMAALMDRETGPTLPPGARHRPRGLQAHAARALCQHRDPGHGGAGEHRRADQPARRSRSVPGCRRIAASTCWASPWPPGCAGCAARTSRVGRSRSVTPSPTCCARRREGGRDPAPLLAIRPLFGEIGEDPQLVRVVAAWLGSLCDVGSRATLQRAARDGLCCIRPRAALPPGGPSSPDLAKALFAIDSHLQ